MSFPVGEVASVGAAVCWAIGLTLFRNDVQQIGARAVNLFKGVVAFGALAIVTLFTGFPAMEFDTAALLVLSGLVGLTIGDTLLFKALGLLGPHRTSLFGVLGPIVTASAGWVFLHEGLEPWQLVGVGFAVAGLALVVYFRGDHKDEPNVHLKGIIFGAGSALCQSAGTLLSRAAQTDVDALSGTTVRLFAASLGLIVYALWRRELGTQIRLLTEPARLKRLIPASLIGSFAGLWLMQLGIKEAPAAVANALHSTTPLFTLPIAVFYLKERLGRAAVLGSLAAVAGVALLLLAGAS